MNEYIRIRISYHRSLSRELLSLSKNFGVSVDWSEARSIQQWKGVKLNSSGSITGLDLGGFDLNMDVSVFGSFFVLFGATIVNFDVSRNSKLKGIGNMEE